MVTIGMYGVIWPLDERNYQFSLLAGSLGLIFAACLAISLFSRSRISTALSFYGTGGLSYFLIMAACFNTDVALGLRLVTATIGLAIGYVAWAYYRWGCQLRDWKADRQHTGDIAPESRRTGGSTRSPENPAP